MSITAALSDIRDALIDGIDAETAIADAAADYSLSIVMVRNRAATAYGDLATYAERTAATRTITPETARKLALGAARETIQRLGAVPAGSAQADKLQAAIDEANRNGGRFSVTQSFRRA